MITSERRSENPEKKRSRRNRLLFLAPVLIGILTGCVQDDLQQTRLKLQEALDSAKDTAASLIVDAEQLLNAVRGVNLSQTLAALFLGDAALNPTQNDEENDDEQASGAGDGDDDEEDEEEEKETTIVAPQGPFTFERAEDGRLLMSIHEKGESNRGLVGTCRISYLFEEELALSIDIQEGLLATRGLAENDCAIKKDDPLEIKPWEWQGVSQTISDEAHRGQQIARIVLLVRDDKGGWLDAARYRSYDITSVFQHPEIIPVQTD